MPTAHYHGVASALHGLAAMAETGYYQLYFLLVIAQFYLVFPLVAALLRRTKGHHGLVLAVAALAQVALAVLTHWQLLPRLMLKYAQQDGLSYLLYLVGGCIVACHLEAVDAWVRQHARLIVALTVAAALAAEGVYFLAHYGVTTVLGATSDPFQPSVIPFNIGAIACGYLAGVALVRPGRSRFTRAVVRSGSDNAYGIYLSHMLVLDRAALARLAERRDGAPLAAALPADRGHRRRLLRPADRPARPDSAGGAADRTSESAVAEGGNHATVRDKDLDFPERRRGRTGCRGRDLVRG